jgi:hypothetical protein
MMHGLTNLKDSKILIGNVPSRYIILFLPEFIQELAFVSQIGNLSIGRCSGLRGSARILEKIAHGGAS